MLEHNQTLQDLRQAYSSIYDAYMRSSKEELDKYVSKIVQHIKNEYNFDAPHSFNKMSDNYKISVSKEIWSSEGFDDWSMQIEEDWVQAYDYHFTLNFSYL